MPAPEERTSRIISGAYVALLIGAAAFGVTAISSESSAATPKLGIVIPLYSNPALGLWNTVIIAKEAYPNVPFVAVVNPASGPGTSQDLNYARGIAKLQEAGVTVLGYVDTAYGGDTVATVETEVNLYEKWYAVDGIMFDEMSNKPGFEGYYATLGGYVRSEGMAVSMGNPGARGPTTFIGALDFLGVYEGGKYPPSTSVTYSGYSASNFATIVYGVPLDGAFLASLKGVNSWV